MEAVAVVPGVAAEEEEDAKHTDIFAVHNEPASLSVGRFFLNLLPIQDSAPKVIEQIILRIPLKVFGDRNYFLPLVFIHHFENRVRAVNQFDTVIAGCKGEA